MIIASNTNSLSLIITNLLSESAYLVEFYLQISVLLTIVALATSSNIDVTKKPLPTVSRTELKVSRSLNPEDMQTLNVMTRDGSVAQLIVKKRDPKSKGSTGSLPEVYNDIYNSYRSLFRNFKRYGEYKTDYLGSGFKPEESYQDLDRKEDQEQIQYPKAVFTNWIPIQSVFYQPKIIRLDSIALVRNATNIKPFNGPLGNVIDSDRFVYITF